MRYDLLLMIISIIFITMGYAKGKEDHCDGEITKILPYESFTKINDI